MKIRLIAARLYLRENKGLNLDQRTKVRPVELSIILPGEWDPCRMGLGRHQKAYKRKPSLVPKTTDMREGIITWLPHATGGSDGSDVVSQLTWFSTLDKK